MSIYYISPTGSDGAGSGTLESPWKTLNQTLAVVAPGDTVYCRGGTYAMTQKFLVQDIHGTSSQRITYSAYQEEVPVFDATDANIQTYDGTVVIRDSSYLSFYNLHFVKGFYVFAIVKESHHLIVDGCHMSEGFGSGIFIGGPNSTPAMSVIRRCVTHHNGQGGITLYSASGGYYRIEYNDAYANSGFSNFDGVQIGGEDNTAGAALHHVIIRRNKIHENGSNDVGEDNLDLGGHYVVHHYLCEENEVYLGKGSFKMNMGDNLFPSGQRPVPGVSGFMIARFNRFTEIGFIVYDQPNHNVFYNNTFINPGAVFRIFADSNVDGLSLGDTTYTGGDTGRMNWKNTISIQEATSSTYAIFAQGGLTPFPNGTSNPPRIMNTSYSSVKLSYNMYKFAEAQKIGWKDYDDFYPPLAINFASYQASYPSNPPDTNSFITTLPATDLFVDVVNRDYRVKPGNPAIGAGTHLTVTTNAGTASTNLHVDRSSYFYDGYPNPDDGQYLGTPDTIIIGTQTPVQIVSQNDTTNVITLASPRTWSIGDKVSLASMGHTPTIGAFQYNTNQLSPPTNLRAIA
jgi:hypothetical protein